VCETGVQSWPYPTKNRSAGPAMRNRRCLNTARNFNNRRALMFPVGRMMVGMLGGLPVLGGRRRVSRFGALVAQNRFAAQAHLVTFNGNDLYQELIAQFQFLTNIADAM